MLKLRDYQLPFVGALYAAWKVVRAVMGVLPTGGGKTVCFAYIMHDHKGVAAAVVHRKEILGQISLALAALEVKHRIVAPPKVITRIRRRHLKTFGRSFVDPHALAGVISVQTLTSRASEKDVPLQRWVRQVSLGVFDEGHHYVGTGKWGKAVHMLGAAKLLFTTASPERADGLGLGAHADGFAEVLVEGPTMQQLIDEAYLAPFKYYCPRTNFDASNIPLTADGDLNMRVMRARVVASDLVGDVVRHYRTYANGKQALVFATDVKTAEDMAAEFCAAGVVAIAVSGETDGRIRDKALDDFEGKALQVLVNVDLFDEGLDVPGVDAVIMARPTESLAKYLQMVGRALRVIYADGFDLGTVEGRRAAIALSPKPHAIIIDPVRNWERHGAPTWPRRWSLDRRAKGSAGTNGELMPQRICLECTQPYERFYKVCPYCGAAPPVPIGRSAPEHVDGDLFELDLAALSELFRKIERADMDTDDFTQDQIRRHVPEIGRPRELRRHLEAKYRRGVLRQLVAWWVGMQPDGRPMDEIHRRFFHRFGIDIGSAFTLKAPETDALMQVIASRFSEDLQPCQNPNYTNLTGSV